MIPCAQCHGAGVDRRPHNLISVKCTLCDGTGSLPWDSQFHSSRKLRRIIRKITKRWRTSHEPDVL